MSNLIIRLLSATVKSSLINHKSYSFIFSRLNWGLTRFSQYNLISLDISKLKKVIFQDLTISSAKF